MTQTGSSTTASTTSTERSGLLWGIAAYTFWGFITIYWKTLQRFDAFELIGYRITSSAIVMTLGMHFTGNLRPLLRRLRDPQVLRLAMLSSLLLTANWTVYVWAVVHGHVLETALGYFITPIGLMVAGVVVLHERLRPAQKVVLVLASAAVVVLSVGAGTVPWVALAIASTWVCYAMTKKRSTLNAFESLTAETLAVIVPALLVVAFTSNDASSLAQSASPTQWAVVGGTGIITAIPLLMFAVAAQRMQLSILALIQYIVPTINFFLGWLLYDEALNATRVVGFALVWAGLAIVTADSLRHRLSTQR